MKRKMLGMGSKPMRKPIFVLSLDLELLWGLIGTQSYKSINLLKAAGGTRLREHINFLIDLLQKYRIQATWAVVGHLLVDPCDEKKYHILENRSWTTCAHSSDTHKHSYGNSLYFGRDILEGILSSTVKHEIACHSFTHAIFSKIGKEAAELEIQAGVEIAKQFGISFKSFVFPQNEIRYTDLLKKHGFIIYRGKTPRHESLLCASQKVEGLVNEIIAPPVTPERKDGIWEIPSSMHFCDPKYPYSLLPRAKLGLWRAIRSNMVFHVWMHPWNLLEYKLLSRDFEHLIKYVSRKRNDNEIDVMTMKDLADYLDARIVG